MKFRKKIPQMEPWFDKAEAKAVFNYMKSGGWVMEFKKTEELEKIIADFTGARYAVMLPNGTISLTIALLALGLKTGDEVLVPDMTMVASPNSAALVGIKPILVDIEPETLCMDLKQAKKSLTSKTKALMYVPFNGRSNDMDEVVKFCKNNKLYLIEDAAQALGSFWEGKHLGTFGDIGSFSFSVPKIITTGQGGALVTNNKKIYQKIKRLKDFGRTMGGNDIHDYMGWNFKFTDLQAVVGLEQMKKLSWRLKRKKALWKRYFQGLKNVGDIAFIPTNLENTVPWFIDIFTAKRDQLARYLGEKGIGTRSIYPPIHSQKIYKLFYKDKNFPVTGKFAAKGLWLPSSSNLKDDEIRYVCGKIKEFYK